MFIGQWRMDQFLHLGISGARTTSVDAWRVIPSILALGNKWCKDNMLLSVVIFLTILALGNKWCKDNAMLIQFPREDILALGNKWCKDNSSG